MTIPNEDAFNLAKKLNRLNEGYRQFPYHDTSKHKLLTVAIGRNLETKGISVDEAEYMQENDLRDACELLAKRIPWYADMSPVRQAVFIDMAMNMPEGFFTFTDMLEYAKKGDYDKAADEILDSRWLSQVGDRCRRAAKIMRENVYVAE